MKRLSSLFCIIFALACISHAWSADDKKPKKLHPTVLVKKAAPKTVRMPPAKPVTSPVTALSDAREPVVTTKTDPLPPTPWQAIAAEQSSMTMIAIGPTATMATPPPTNPYLQSVPRPAPSSPPISGMIPPNPIEAIGRFAYGLREFLPTLPTEGQAIFPVIKTVYPTGEKPLKVLTFKCPTEVIGISTPPMKALHGLVDIGMLAFNSANLFPFDMQQVCQ